MNALVQYNTLPSSISESSSSSLPFSTIMMSPSSLSLCEPRRVSLDEVSLKEQIAHVVSDDDESDDDDDAIIPSSFGWTVGKKRRIEAISSKASSSSSSTPALKSCLSANNNKKAKVLITTEVPNNNNKTRKLLRFLAEPIVLGRSADVQMENAHNVWYTKPELSAIRRECKLAIAQGVVDRRRNGGQQPSSTSSDSLQLRGLERWTSQVQYHARQMASKTLRSELYIEQSSQRLFLDNHHTSTSTIIINSNNPQERLAEISRQHSAPAVASALRLAQVDASC
jgi:hypothetical protein